MSPVLKSVIFGLSAALIGASGTLVAAAQQANEGPTQERAEQQKFNQQESIERKNFDSEEAKERAQFNGTPEQREAFNKKERGERKAFNKEGDLIPPIELQSSDGTSITLPHGTSSRLRAIYFSATWCESYMKSTQPGEAENCKVGREQIDKLASDQRMEWYGVMSHLWTTPKALAKYESMMKPGFPLAVDSSGAAFRTFGVKRFPAVALIDTQGRLAKLVEGDPRQFAAAIWSAQASK